MDRGKIKKEPPSFPPSLLAILPDTRLTHITIPDWPTEKLLNALPPTIISLRMKGGRSVGQYNNDNPESLLKACSSWKPQFLPALEVLDLDVWYFFLTGEEDKMAGPILFQKVSASVRPTAPLSSGNAMNVRSIAGDFAVALLRDVRVLHLHITGTESARPALSSEVFEDLKHLYVSWEWTEEGPQRGDSAILHHINPASLVALKLVDASYKNLEVLGSLGEMPNLRSLSVTSIDQEESNKEPPNFPPSLVAILPNTRLTHVTIPDWPTDEFLNALPPTIISLRMKGGRSVGQYNNDNPESLLKACSRWKPQFLPALEVLDLDVWYSFLIEMGGPNLFRIGLVQLLTIAGLPVDIVPESV
ncbi:hypothetical protein RQP46_002636 [Phenoliferia psychrophenolica]